MFTFWINTMEQGLIFSIMVLGVFITYKILDFPDLSVDGSFPLGAAVAASMLTRGVDPIITSILALLMGMLAGFFTGILHVKFKITNLLSGILVMIGLYSINLRVMGKANVHLFDKETLFSNNINPLIIILAFMIITKLVLDFLLKTKFGFILKATGDNPQLVTSLGINIGTIKILGLMIANGFVSLSGAILAQYQGFSDVGMGAGMIVMGLASIILGEAILKKTPLNSPTIMAVIGALLYQIGTGFALKLGFPATDLKLITVIIIVLALAFKNNPLKFNLKKFIFTGGDSPVTNTKSA
ncbi:ABC transporter permease [Clostridiisalibacter paucivorans]|uniref:ABC transporter permease n=1 Tax=Clostridiisalibacter paucivorans TaxID=408753 RepID=UPI000479824D|nr:ABC transporter [Clostridiisalibacter paucivorans]